MVPIENREGLTPLQVGSVSVNPVTAYRLLRDFVELRPGAWWVLNGANSGVGRMALQLGRRWGYRGIAIVRGRDDEAANEDLKREMRDLGAEVVVTDEEAREKGFGERVKEEWTGGGGGGGRGEIRLGLNCVGGDSAMQMAKILGTGATMVTYGAMSKAPMRVGAASLIFRDVRFLGFWVSRWGDENPEEKRRTVEEILEMYRDGSLTDVPYVSVSWSWETKREDLVDAVRGTLEGYRKGKGVFVFENT